MEFTLLDNQRVGVTVSAIDALGKPTTSVLSAVAFTSSDPGIATVAADPANANGAILTGVAEGVITLTATATATESDSTTHSITGSVTVTLTAAAAALAFTFGTPSPNR